MELCGSTRKCRMLRKQKLNRSIFATHQFQSLNLSTLAGLDSHAYIPLVKVVNKQLNI